MVKLDTEYIVKKILKIKSCNEKQKKEALKKVNHLCSSERSIHEIGDLAQLVNVSVLYLHENNIKKIENFDKSINLTHLYLQHNDIEKIENINHLQKLKKLYLGFNRIAVVESLDNLINLEELHIESQKLPPGESIYFDPRTVKTLAGVLRFLDISNNRMTSLDDLQELRTIEEVDASNNNISDIISTCRVLTFWNQLEDLKLQGNPVTRVGKYRDKIITLTNKLGSLDGKVINEETRVFLQQFEVMKVERQKMEAKQSRLKFSSDITSLAQHLPPGIRNSISRRILKETLPSTMNLSLSLNQIPAIKELSLERRMLANRPPPKKIWKRKNPLKVENNPVMMLP